MTAHLRLVGERARAAPHLAADRQASGRDRDVSAHACAGVDQCPAGRGVESPCHAASERERAGGNVGAALHRTGHVHGAGRDDEVSPHRSAHVDARRGDDQVAVDRTIDPNGLGGSNQGSLDGLGRPHRHLHPAPRLEGLGGPWSDARGRAEHQRERHDRARGSPAEVQPAGECEPGHRGDRQRHQCPLDRGRVPQDEEDGFHGGADPVGRASVAQDDPPGQAGEGNDGPQPGQRKAPWIGPAPARDRGRPRRSGGRRGERHRRAERRAQDTVLVPERCDQHPAAPALREMALGGPGLVRGQLSVHVHGTRELARARHRQTLSSRSASSRRRACLPRKIRIATLLRVTPSWPAISS